MRRFALAVTCALLCAVACRSPQPVAPTPLGPGARSEPAAPRVPVLSRYQIAFDVPERSVHPDDVVVAARFTSPSRRVSNVGGFASRDRFVVRFTPREVGEHTYVVFADGGKGPREVARGSFVATPSSARGFARVDPEAPHRIMDDRRETVFVLGENRINVYDPEWNYENVGTAEYLRRMKAYGMSTIRVFVFADCEKESAAGPQQIGCLEPEIGRFDEVTADAFDELFDAASASDIDVILVAYAVGFTPPPETWRSWADNPYSTHRGGPIADPVEFFSDARFRENAIRKLRYIADRWGYSPRLLAIDLLNEPEWDGPIPERVWIPWAEEMAAAWRGFDPYGHLVTAGPVGLHWNVGAGDERPWYASPENDIVQWHLYGRSFYDPYALALEMTRKVDETWGFGKPVVCGEFAYGGEDKTTYDHTHNGIWSLSMSGAGALAHSAPPFEIDSDEPMTPARGAHFRVLSDFLRSFDRTKALVPAHDVRASGGARAWSLAQDDGSRALWVLGPRQGYGDVVRGVSLTVPSPPRGRWGVVWIDDGTGRELSSAALEAPGEGEITLSVPSFRRHVAARLARR